MVDFGVRLALQVSRSRPGYRHNFIVNALYFERRGAKCFTSPKHFLFRSLCH